jgi:hypothetical protein
VLSLPLVVWGGCHPTAYSNIATTDSHMSSPTKEALVTPTADIVYAPGATPLLRLTLRAAAARRLGLGPGLL